MRTSCFDTEAYGRVDAKRGHCCTRHDVTIGTCKINTTQHMQTLASLGRKLASKLKQAHETASDLGIIWLSMDWMGLKPKPPTKSPRHLDMLYAGFRILVTYMVT